MTVHLETFPSVTALQQGAAKNLFACLQGEILARGRASFVLSGGVTPRGVYELLGSEFYRPRIDWKKIHFFWGDERCVGPTMPESNFRMANEALLRNIPLPPQNIHRIRGEVKPRIAAQEYETDIRRFFNLKEGEFPHFSLVLLGLGEDGHTASLFPGTPVLEERRRIVAEVHVESLATSRVTLTVPTINNAGDVCFIVSGRSKARIVHEVLEGPAARYPAQLITPSSGRISWLLDNEAASQIAKVQTA